jgi:hypothetical protein
LSLKAKFFSTQALCSIASDSCNFATATKSIMSTTQVNSDPFPPVHVAHEQQLIQGKQANIQARHGIKCALWFNGLSLLPWPGLAFLCLFAFDKPGSETNPLIWSLALPIFFYPIYTAIFTIIGLLLKSRSHLQLAQFVLSLPRRIVNYYILFFFVTAILIELKNN